MKAQEIVQELRGMKLTQQQIATHAKVSQAAISQIEHGKTVEVRASVYLALQDLLKKQRAAAARKAKAPV